MKGVFSCFAKPNLFKSITVFKSKLCSFSSVSSAIKESNSFSFVGKPTEIVTVSIRSNS